MRHPVLPSGQTGCLGYRGKFPGLTLALEVFARREFHGFGLLDLDLLAGLGVDAHASCTLGNFERAKADELNVFGFLQTDFDAVDHCGHCALCFSFAGAEGLLDGFNEFCLVHGLGFLAVCSGFGFRII